jgi:hypothetical protein
MVGLARTTLPATGNSAVFSVGLVPAVLDFRNLEDLFIEAELSRSLVGLVAGVGVNVDGKGHGPRRHSNRKPRFFPANVGASGCWEGQTRNSGCWHGSGTSANAPIMRFRVNSFDGATFKTVWSPEDFFDAKVTVTDRDFLIEHRLQPVRPIERRTNT